MQLRRVLVKQIAQVRCRVMRGCKRKQHGRIIRVCNLSLYCDSLERAVSWPSDDTASYLRIDKMRPKKQKPPICIGGSENLHVMDAPPLDERTFPRSLPRKRGRCREAIGMGLAYHCLYLILTVTSFQKFVNT